LEIRPTKDFGDITMKKTQTSDGRDEDCYTFKIPQAGYYTFAMNLNNSSGNNTLRIDTSTLPIMHSTTSNKMNFVEYLNAGTYNFVVFNNSNISNPYTLDITPPVTTTTTAPAKPVLSVTQSGYNAKLTWTAVSGAARYAVYRSSNNGGTWVAVNENVAAGTLTLTDTAAAPNTSYDYAIHAVSATGQWSGYNTPTVFLGKPNITLAQQGNGVKISWQAITGQPAIAKYAVYRSTDNGAHWVAVNENVSTSTLSITDNAAPTNTPLVYAVHAVTADGKWSGYVQKGITVV
jgi:hypothetical protein